MHEYSELNAQAMEEMYMSDLIEEYAGLKRRQKQIETEVKDVRAKAFRFEAQKLFDDNPKLECFGWHQYTPYFCDGDPCHFGCHKDEPAVNDFPYYDGPGDTDLFYSEADHKVLVKIIKEYLKQYSQEEMLFVFGDHADIEIDRDGSIKIGKYEHE